MHAELRCALNNFAQRDIDAVVHPLVLLLLLLYNLLFSFLGAARIGREAGREAGRLFICDSPMLSFAFVNVVAILFCCSLCVLCVFCACFVCFAFGILTGKMDFPAWRVLRRRTRQW